MENRYSLESTGNAYRGESKGASGSSGFPMLSFGQYVYGRSLKTSVIIWPGQNDKLPLDDYLSDYDLLLMEHGRSRDISSPCQYVMAQNLQIFSPTREQENGYNMDILSWIVLKGH